MSVIRITHWYDTLNLLRRMLMVPHKARERVKISKFSMGF